MTRKERLARLERHGYKPRHLFGNWYWVRAYPHSLYHLIVKIKDDIPEDENLDKNEKDLLTKQRNMI